MAARQSAYGLHLRSSRQRASCRVAAACTTSVSRARSREDVDFVHTLLLELDATVVHAPREEGWVPGYYSVLFEDPDGIRLEVNYVPGKGVFAPDVERKDSAAPRAG